MGRHSFARNRGAAGGRKFAASGKFCPQFDVEEGLVSPAAARDIYGVVVDPETLAYDAAATAALRSKDRRAGL